MTTIDERCQELAKQIQLIIDGRITKFDNSYRKFISGRVNNLIEDLIKKSEYHRNRVREVIYSILEDYFLMESPPLEIEDFNRAVFYYDVEDSNGFRSAEFRSKMVSNLSSKIMRNYFLKKTQLGEEEKKYSKNIRDAVAFRIIADHPDTPEVDFLSLYESKDTEWLLDFIKDNQDLFVTGSTSIDDYAEAADKGFETLFSTFKEAYREGYEGKNWESLYSLAWFIQDNVKSLGRQKMSGRPPRYEILNVSDIAMKYRHWDVTVASQSLFYIGDPTGKLSIHEDIIVFGNESAAKEYVDDMKEAIRFKRSRAAEERGVSEKSSPVKFNNLGEKDSQIVHQGAYTIDESEGNRLLLMRNGNVVLAFRGSLENRDFFGEVIGKSAGKERIDGLAKITLSAAEKNLTEDDKKKLGAHHFRIPPMFIPEDYLTHHYTDSETAQQTYMLKKTHRKQLFFKDYLSIPRDDYEGLHGTIIEKGSSEYREPVEIQLRTSLGHFEAEKGKASSDDFEKLKDERIDLKTKDLECRAQERKKKLLERFRKDVLPEAIISFYNSRIYGEIEDIKASFRNIVCDSHPSEGFSGVDASLKRIDFIVDQLTRDFTLLRKEFPRRSFDYLKRDIALLPDTLRAEKDTPSAAAYLDNLEQTLTRRGFPAGEYRNTP